MAAYSLIFAKFGAVMRKPSMRRIIDTAIGTILVGFGVRLAFTEA